MSCLTNQVELHVFQLILMLFYLPALTHIFDIVLFQFAVLLIKLDIIFFGVYYYHLLDPK